jgi:PAS domain S-box-containing protein
MALGIRDLGCFLTVISINLPASEQIRDCETHLLIKVEKTIHSFSQRAVRLWRSFIGFVLEFKNRILSSWHGSIPAYLLLLLSLMATTLVSGMVYLNAEQEASWRFDQDSQSAVNTIRNRIATYENALLHTRALFAAKENVSREDFRNFVSSLELEERYPGLQGIGLAVRIAPNRIADHEKTVREEGFEQYSIWPTHPRNEYTSIIYLEPFDWRNQRAFGYDMFSDPVRRKAMSRARDTGRPAMTERVFLMQETSVNRQPGFLLYVPVYKSGEPIDTVEQRRSALIGYVYSPFRAEDLFRNVLNAKYAENEFDVEIHDTPHGSASSSNLLFNSHGSHGAADDPSRIWTSSMRAKQHVIHMPGTNWTVTTYAPHGLSMSSNRHAPWYVFFGGLLISGLLFRMSLSYNAYSAHIRKSENQLRLVTDSLPALIAYFDSKWNYQFANAAHESWLGLHPSETKGKNIFQVLGTQLPSWDKDTTQRLFSGERVTFESYIPHRSLGLRPVRIDCTPNLREDGALAGFVILATDISEQKAWTQKLREDKRALELMNTLGLYLRGELDPGSLNRKTLASATEILHAQIGLFIPDDKLGQAPLAAFIDDSSDQQIVVSALTQTLDAEVLASLESPLAKFINSNRVQRIQDVSQTLPHEAPQIERHLMSLSGFAANHAPHDGENQPLVRGAISVPLGSRSGERFGHLVLFHSRSGFFNERDEQILDGLAAQASVAFENSRLVDALRCSEAYQRSIAEENETLYREAQSANRAKDEFLAVLSHELRTPLTAIQGHAELLKHEHTPEELGESIEAIERNAKVQNQLVSDLLDVSSIIAGKIQIHTKPVLIHQCIKASIKSLCLTATARNVGIETDLRDRECLVLGDETRIQQILWNLITNAIKFTEPGGKISILSFRENGCYEIRVSDTGQGIDPEFLPYVFDRFRQEDYRTTRRHGGLGLGLSIVRNLVELHHGQIEVHSAGRGQGSQFIVKLPLLEASTIQTDLPFETLSLSNKTPSKAAHTSLNPSERLKNNRILVVDDEPDARLLITRYLERAGAKVKAAASAKEAMDALGPFDPEVIVSDISMPEEDGHSLIRRIRAEERSQNRPATPAIALTAFAQHHDISRSLESGFNSHVTKPVGAKVLTEVVCSLLES